MAHIESLLGWWCAASDDLLQSPEPQGLNPNGIASRDVPRCNNPYSTIGVPVYLDRLTLYHPEYPRGLDFRVISNVPGVR